MLKLNPKNFWRIFLPKKKICPIFYPHIWYTYVGSLDDIPNHTPIIPNPQPSHCSFFIDGIIFHVVLKLHTGKSTNIENLKA